MAGNLSSLGFVFESADHARQLIAELAGYAVHRTAALPGDYAIWRSGSGAEIWYQVEGERSFFGRMDGGQVVGFHPFFAGEGKLPVRVERLVQGPQHNQFEGLFVGEACEADAAYKLAFDAMDYAVHELRATPIVAIAQIVGFAEQTKLYGSEQALIAAHGVPDVPVRAFVGDKRIGFGSADNDNMPGAQGRERAGEGIDMGNGTGQGNGTATGIGAAFMPNTAGLLRGVIAKHSVLDNEVTERSYHWLLVDGPGGSFDIVAARDMFREPVAAGMIVEVIANFSGRLPG